MKMKALVLVGVLIASPAVAQQNFSCSWGDRGACLGYGETVCSSMGKCVNQNAACFDSYQCDFEGFTCKSNVTKCVKDYNALLGDHNDLVNKYNDLLGEHSDLVTKYNDLLSSSRAIADELTRVRSERDDLQDELDAANEGIEDIRSCLARAETIADAQSCRWRGPM